MQLLINSSFLLNALCEEIYSRKINDKSFSFLDVQAFWSNATACFSDIERAYSIATKSTALLSSAEKQQIMAQLTREQWARFETLTGTEPWPVPAASDEPETNLDLLKATLKEQVDREAETARLQYVTNGCAQSMVYRQKMDEAQLVLADPSVSKEAVPHIATEAAINGITLAEMAKSVVQAFQEWRAVSAIIEGKRMAAKKAISEGLSADQIYSAANVEWNLSA